MTSRLFCIGDRVVYRDPEDTRNPLAGEVIAVAEHAITVRYDAHPQAPGLVGADAASSCLRLEQDDPSR